MLPIAKREPGTLGPGVADGRGGGASARFRHPCRHADRRRLQRITPEDLDRVSTTGASRPVEPGFLATAGGRGHRSVQCDGRCRASSTAMYMWPQSCRVTRTRPEDWLTHSDLDRAFDGVVFASAMLQQGFTSARDVGGGDDTVALRNAINAGKVPGPRMWVSLEPLGPTGGHADPHAGLDRAQVNHSWENGIVNTPDEARLRVREHKRRGADLIKMLPSGGIASTGDNPRQQLMTDDEMRAAVETAHSLGLKVAAHIYPAGAIEAAVRAGVDSVEHGSFATAQTFALMKEHGTYLVPTLTVYDLFYDVANPPPRTAHPGHAGKGNCQRSAAEAQSGACDTVGSEDRLWIRHRRGRPRHGIQIADCQRHDARRRAPRRDAQRGRPDRRQRSHRHNPAGDAHADIVATAVTANRPGAVRQGRVRHERRRHLPAARRTGRALDSAGSLLPTCRRRPTRPDRARLRAQFAVFVEQRRADLVLATAHLHAPAR